MHFSSFWRIVKNWLHFPLYLIVFLCAELQYSVSLRCKPENFDSFDNCFLSFNFDIKSDWMYKFLSIKCLRTRSAHNLSMELYTHLKFNVTTDFFVKVLWLTSQLPSLCAFTYPLMLCVLEIFCLGSKEDTPCKFKKTILSLNSIMLSSSKRQTL